MPDNIVLIMRFHPVGGKTRRDRRMSAGSRGAWAIAPAQDERRGLVLTQAKYDREDGQSGVMINLARAWHCTVRLKSYGVLHGLVP